MEIYRICRHHHKRLVVHAAPVQPPIHFPKSSYYLVVADDFEALLLAGCKDLDASIYELHHRGVQNLIITPPHHSLIFSDGIRSSIQPVPAAPFVQTRAPSNVSRPGRALPWPTLKILLTRPTWERTQWHSALPGMVHRTACLIRSELAIEPLPEFCPLPFAQGHLTLLSPRVLRRCLDESRKDAK